MTQLFDTNRLTDPLSREIVAQLPEVRDSNLKAVAERSLSTGLHAICSTANLHSSLSKKSEEVIESIKQKAAKPKFDFALFDPRDISSC